ncbi:hypothetical protein AMECASPLE_024569, partial [Ameca splendens]
YKLSLRRNTHKNTIFSFPPQHTHVRVMNVSFMGVTSKVSGSGENAALPPRSAQQECPAPMSDMRSPIIDGNWLFFWQSAFNVSFGCS